MESTSPEPGSERSAQSGNNPGGRENSPVDDAAVRIAELLMIKPKWRGWIHTVTAPLAFAAGLVLVLLAPTAELKTASAVYAFTGVLLFGVSAVYHRGNWSPGVKIVLKRLDHTSVQGISKEEFDGRFNGTDSATADVASDSAPPGQ